MFIKYLNEGYPNARPICEQKDQSQYDFYIGIPKEFRPL